MKTQQIIVYLQVELGLSWEEKEFTAQLRLRTERIMFLFWFWFNSTNTTHSKVLHSILCIMHVPLTTY